MPFPNDQNFDSNGSTDCPHSLRIGSLCAFCGQEILRGEDLVPALHKTDKLALTSEAAQKLQNKNLKKLEKIKKMILILDLDQTILHSSLQESDCDFKFVLVPSTFYVKLRPFFLKFLKKIHKLFEIHVYTMGTREYAKEICSRIDPKRIYFKDRIVSRSENFNELKKSIDRITSIHSNVVILDDRADVWDFSKNLILIKPFWYHNEIDINDPVRIQMNRERLLKEKIEKERLTVDEKDPINNKIDLPVTGEDTEENTKMVDLNRTDEDPFDSTRIIQIMPMMPITKPEDLELQKILKILRKIHSKYFETKKDVRRLLRIKTMKRIRIYSHSDNFQLIKFSGAQLDSISPSLVVDNRELAEKFKVLNVSVSWLYRCIYERRAVETMPFVISDHREKFEMNEEDLFSFDSGVDFE